MSNNFCTKCGANILPGDRFCTGCGAEINLKEFCKNCGAEVNKGQAFCTKCGFALLQKPIETQKTIEKKPVEFKPQPQAKPATVKPAKKSKTGLIIGIIIALIVLATAAFITVRYLSDDAPDDFDDTNASDDFVKPGDEQEDEHPAPDEDDQAASPEDDAKPDDSSDDSETPAVEVPEEVVADSVIASGSEVNGLNWVLEDTGALTLEGEVSDWGDDSSSYAWHDHIDEILYVNVSEGVTSIGAGAFANAVNLHTAELPYGVEAVYPDAFSQCSSLTYLEFFDGLQVLMENCFNSCSGLETILLPATLKSIESGAFADCSSLTAIYYTGTKAEWKAIAISDEGNEVLKNVFIHCLDADIIPLDIKPIESEMNQILQEIAGNAKWSLFISKINGTEALTSENVESLSASAMVIVPILYTVAAEVDAGNLSLSDAVTITMNTGGRTQLAGSIGKSITINELCRYMLLYSDNIATNTLLQHLGFERIVNVCAQNGFASVYLANYLMQTQDNTTNDNYVSTQDLCCMLSELYSDTFMSLGKQFLRDNMVIQDSTAREGLIASMSGNLTIMNLNGQKADKYNEVVIVDDGTNAFVMAFMSNGSDLASLKHAAQEIGAYMISRLGVGQ